MGKKGHVIRHQLRTRKEVKLDNRLFPASIKTR